LIKFIIAQLMKMCICS